MTWDDPNIRPGFYLGPLGSLMPLPDLKGDLGREGGRNVQFKTNLSGHRRGYYDPAGPREWAVTIPQCAPDEAQGIIELIDTAEQGMIWIDPVMPLTNLLTPRAASVGQGWSNLSGDLGPRDTPDGRVWHSFVANTSPIFPVIPGKPVTVAAYASTTGTATVMRIQWMDLAGEIISDAGATPVTTGALQRRVSTVVTPAGVHAARINFTGADNLIASPTVTWTTGPQVRSAGMGCAAAWAHGLSVTPMLTRLGLVRQALSFTVTEVA